MVEKGEELGQRIDATNDEQFGRFMNEIAGSKPLDMAFSLAVVVRNGLPEVLKLVHAGVARSRDH